MGRDFFALEGAPANIDQIGLIDLVATNPTLIENFVYQPNTLLSPSAPFRWKIEKIRFRNVSFSRTLIENFEFSECVFERCLFTWSILRDCRFVLCEFIDTNPHRLELHNVFVDPREFRKCIVDKSYSNIGVHIYQELLRSSKSQAQVIFIDEAQFWLSRWERHLLSQFAKREKRTTKRLQLRVRVGLKWLYDVALGSGTSLSRLSISYILSLFALTLFNWLMSERISFQDSHGAAISTWIDMFYVTTIIVTTLGFGDITPAHDLGRVIVSFEAMIGFVLLAVLSSTIYRRISA